MASIKDGSNGLLPLERLWRRVILAAIAGVFLVGVAPLGYLFWEGSGNKIEPLLMPLSLVPGEYTSDFFVTKLDGDYQVQLYFLPPGRTPLNFDWKIVDDHGKVLQSGHYQDQNEFSNSANLGHYRPAKGLHQRAIVDIHQGSPAPDAGLHIGQPEESLGISYAIVPAGVWCLVFTVISAVALLTYLLRRNAHERKIDAVGQE